MRTEVSLSHVHQRLLLHVPTPLFIIKVIKILSEKRDSGKIKFFNRFALCVSLADRCPAAIQAGGILLLAVFDQTFFSFMNSPLL